MDSIHDDDPPNRSEAPTRDLLQRLTADAKRRWGPERAAALAGALAAAAATLAQVAATELTHDDEPDFIR